MRCNQLERIRRERLHALEAMERELDREHSDDEQRRAAAALGVLHHLPAQQRDLELSPPA